MADPNEGDPLAQFIVNAPLYTPLRIGIPPPTNPMASLLTFDSGLSSLASIPTPEIVLPEYIRRACSKCGGTPRWVGSHKEPERTVKRYYIHTATYLCSSCSSLFVILFQWVLGAEGVVGEKLGEFPRRGVVLPEGVGEALGALYADWFRESLELREAGYGIGALVYIRRIVEGMTDQLLEILARAMEEVAEPQEKVAKIRLAIKEEKNFTKKMELAAGALPRGLLRFGQNPYQTMFEVVSGGLHGDTDEECMAIVDALKESMLLVLEKLSLHIDKGAAYDQAVKDLQRLRTKREGDK